LGCLAKLLVCAMTAARQFRPQAPLHGVALLATAALSSWLIPGHGLLGAAWAVCAGMASLVVGSVAVNMVAVWAAERREHSQLTGEHARGVSGREVGSR
jgi:hypothetical protein